MRRGVLGGLLGGLLLVVFCGVPGAWAVAPGPGFQIDQIPSPTNLLTSDGEGADRYVAVITNSGSQPTDGPITITDTLPAGVTAEGAYGQALNGKEVQALDCVAAPVVRCTFTGVLGVDDLIELDVHVAVAGSASGTVTNSVVVSGGGAGTPVVSNATSTLNALSPLPGLDAFSLTTAGADGTLDTQAGDHPYEVTANLNFATKHEKSGSLITTRVALLQEVKDVVVNLPLGFLGNTHAAAQCTESELAPPGGNASETSCPANSMVGMVTVDEYGRLISSAQAGTENLSPIFNMVPERGYPAEFGLDLLGKQIMLYATAVPTPAGYVLRVFSPGIPRVIAIAAISLTFWGVPAESAHTKVRGVPSGVAAEGFLTNPVDCSAGPLKATAMADTWEHPGSYTPDGSPNLADPAWRVLSTVVYPSITGCDLLQFSPGVALTPTTTQADEPSGLNVTLSVPQAPQLPPDLTTPEVKDVSVTFPAGFSLSPSAGDGLQACSPAQIGFGSSLPGSCPDASVLGTVKVTTPLLSVPLEGQLFLGEPGCDPCSNADAADGNMFHLYLEVQGAGVVLKQPGTAYVNPSTGQVTTTFDDNPQLPFSELTLALKGGLRAPLATPQGCGTYTSTSDFTPWSAPITPDATPSSSFNVDWDGDGGACPAVSPFAPSFSAGTSNPGAGQFSPFTLTFARQDREQDLSQIQVRMPPGLSGILSGVPLCEEPQAALGTCPVASRIGTMTVAAGAGGHPFYTQGSIYLTGPYAGAPFGLSIVVPTVAGPFNLGNVVVRSKIDVDPFTAALTVTSDPFPQVIDGIPLRLRTANVTIDRPGFIINPTSCEQQHITATIASAQGAQAQVSAPFAASGCRGLKFTPTFKASTSGRTSHEDGASLDAEVVYPAGEQGAEANIRSFKVELPKQLPARLSTLQKACTEATFQANPAACPAASVIGIARVSTPLLPVKLSGPVYFVSRGGERYPQLEIVIQGYGVRVDVVGDTFINSKTGITSTTIASAPDVPFNSFELYLPEGKASALAANGNLCTSTLRMPTTFTAQNGTEINQSTKVTVTGCPKARRARSARIASHRQGDRKKGTR
jgi:hypothetical protein